jgi:hypothetical protein
VCSRKTALLRVPLIFASRISCPVGRAPHMIPRFIVRPAEQIFTCRRGGIILRMLALLHQMRYLSLIEACGTICLSGIVPRERMLFIFS